MATGVSDTDVKGLLANTAAGFSVTTPRATMFIESTSRWEYKWGTTNNSLLLLLNTHTHTLWHCMMGAANRREKAVTVFARV